MAISDVGEGVCTFGGQDCFEGVGDGLFEFVEGSRRGFAQEGLELCENLFDWIEVGR